MQRMDASNHRQRIDHTLQAFRETCPWIDSKSGIHDWLVKVGFNQEDILLAAHRAGASSAGYVLLRLPHEVKILFREWLGEHYPQRAKHVMSLINQTRGGKDYDAKFGERMVGTGAYAKLLRTRFELARRKCGFDSSHDRHELSTHLFRAPLPEQPQLTLDF